MPLRVPRPATFLVLAVLLRAVAPASPAFTLRADRADGLYALGDTAVFTAEAAATDAPAGTTAWTLTLDGGRTLAHGVWTDLATPLRVTGGLDEPGILRLTVVWKAEAAEGEARAVAGAAFAPEGIRAGAAAPDDFDAFWGAQRDALAAVPLDARLEERPDYGTEDYTVFKLSLATLDGARVRGYVAVPRNQPGPFPAQVIVPWAGVYPLPRGQLWPAAQGWLVVYVSIHEAEVDLPEEAYQRMAGPGGPLEGYMYRGRESREASYYRIPYLAGVRAIDYIATRADWNRRTLVVSGGSQGGGLALVTGGLDTRVTHVTASVPALCDHFGHRLGRANGWPNWIWDTASAQAESARYYDAVFFAQRLRAPALVGVGLADVVCAPSSVYAAYEAIPTPKEIVVGPTAGHEGPPQFGARREAWLREQGAAP